MPTFVPGMVPRRRTDRVVEAMTKAIEGKRSAIDPGTDVRSVTVVAKLKQGTLDVRSIIVTVESEETLS